MVSGVCGYRETAGREQRQREGEGCGEADHVSKRGLFLQGQRGLWRGDLKLCTQNVPKRAAQRRSMRQQAAPTKNPAVFIL